MSKLSQYIYCKLLPIYIPKSRRFSSKIHIAIWNCMNANKSNSLLEVIKGTRITIRGKHEPIFVIKKGEI